MDITNIEHPSITAENREAFSTHMTKFATMEDAALDGMVLKRMTGQPFKLPADFSKLDDTQKAEFTTGAHKALGIQKVKSVEDLLDLNMKAGMKEGSTTQVDTNIAELLKKTAVEKGWSKSVVQDVVGLYNGPLTEYAAKIKADLAEQAETKKIADAKTTNDALAAHPDFGSAEEVQKQSELFKRAILNNFGYNAEEAEEVAEAMISGGLTSNPKLARILLKTIAPLAAESSTELGGTGKPPVTPTDPDEGSPTYKALGWSKGDSK